MLIKTYNFTGKHAVYMANLVGVNLDSENKTEEEIYKKGRKVLWGINDCT